MLNTVSDYAIPFAAWEVRLFLDTHPNDPEALSAYRQLCAQNLCENNYACLPDTEYSFDAWHWIDDPWPWEPEANCPVTCRAGTNQCRTGRQQPNACARRM